MDIIIGTPGWIKDLIQKGNLKFDSIEALVLDETDVMLDFGFEKDIQEIMDSVKK